MVASKVEIWNHALDLLGEGYTVLDAAETSSQANLCRRTWERVYKAVQRDYPWKCLLTKESLAADATAPVFGFQYRYLLPVDCAKLLQVYYGETSVNNFPWRLVGRYIHTNIAAPLYIDYTTYSEDTSLWDEHLREVVTYRMAADMCEKLTQDGGKESRMYAKLNEVTRMARHSDSMEQQPANFNSGEWVNARFEGQSPIVDTYNDGNTF